MSPSEAVTYYTETQKSIEVARSLTVAETGYIGALYELSAITVWPSSGVVMLGRAPISSLSYGIKLYVI